MLGKCSYCGGSGQIIVADMLRHQREFLGVTQAEVAKQLNVSPSAISKYDHGILLLHQDRALQYAKVLGLVAEAEGAPETR